MTEKSDVLTAQEEVGYRFLFYELDNSFNLSRILVRGIPIGLDEPPPLSCKKRHNILTVCMNQ